MNINKALIAGTIYVTLLFAANNVGAQNKFEEVLPYQNKNGYMIVRANVSGTEGDFLLDSRSGLVLTESAAKTRNMPIEKKSTPPLRKEYEFAGTGIALSMYVGKNMYRKNIPATIIKSNPLFSKLGVDGAIGLSAFTNAVVTLNTKLKTITISGPYRPSFIKIENRKELINNSKGLFLTTKSNSETLSNLMDFFSPEVLKGNNSILKNGLIAFDIERGKYYTQGFGEGESNVVPVILKDEIVIIPGKVNDVDKNYFLKNIYDYKNNKEWKTIGDKPVVVDFWASWCGPCLRMMPTMEELAKKYKDKIIFYKVNVDKEGELRDVFQANAIPLIFFAPLKGNVIRELGADSKEKVEEKLKMILQ